MSGDSESSSLLEKIAATPTELPLGMAPPFARTWLRPWANLSFRVTLPRCALVVWVCAMVALPLGCGSPSRAASTTTAPTTATAAAVGSVCVIEGTVKGADGGPVGGALVAVIVPYSSTEKAIAYTTASGSFCFESIAPGEYSLSVTSAQGVAASVEHFNTRDRGRGLDVRLGSAGFAVRGTVKGEAGRAKGGTRVHLGRQRDSLQDIFVVTCDGEGDFSARLPVGQYWAWVETEASSGLVEDIALDRDVRVDVVLLPRNAPERAPPGEVLAWVKQHAIALASVEPGSGFEDLEPLRAIVGAARVVGVGEATHGTHEFRALRQRLLEFLVERMGFRAVVIEESFAETLADDEYVRTARVEDPSRGSLLNWLRRRNEGKPSADALRYFGDDLRNPARSVTVLAAVVRAIDAKLWAEVEQGLEPLADDWSTFIDVQFDAPMSPRQGATEAAARKIAARLDERRQADVRTLGEERWALARVHAHVLVDFVELLKTKNFDVRDRSMAETTIRLLDVLGPNARIVLFAHNGHLQKLATPIGMQGKLLAERLGADYVVFGSAFDRGSFNAKGPQGSAVFSVGAAPPGSFDGALARVGLPFFALDLRSAEAAARRWLHTPTLARSIGAVYDEARVDAFFDPSAPADRLDAVLFVANGTPLDVSTPSTPAADASSTASEPASQEPSAQIVNGDFEAGRVGDRAPGWQLQSEPGSLSYRARLESGAAHGKHALVLDREPVTTPVGYGSLSQRIDAKPLRGQRVRISANMRLSSRALGDKAFVFAMAETGTLPHAISGQALASKVWRVTGVDVDVPANANTLQLGIIVTGAARVGVDDVRIQLVQR